MNRLPNYIFKIGYIAITLLLLLFICAGLFIFHHFEGFLTILWVGALAACVVVGIYLLFVLVYTGIRLLLARKQDHAGEHAQ